MRTYIIILLLLAASSIAFAARRTTVQELTAALASMHDARKTDEEIATYLKQIQLSEELTSKESAVLEQYLPGPSSLEQLEILRNLSAFEPPAPSKEAVPPPPDAEAQSAILTRAATWLATTFRQSPTFSATKIVLRFQDEVKNMSSTAGLQVDSPNTYVQLAEARTDRVEITQGVEKLITARDKTNWGENGQISEGGPLPTLPEIFQEASASGKPAFARWEILNGKPAAVFTFSVDKKKSRYVVNYCCFPSTDTATGVANAGFGISPGQVQSVTTWRPFKKGVPYHGLLYIDPVKGEILRTITFAELKPSEFVHTENVRINYGLEDISGKSCIVPLTSVTLSEVVPGGDAGTRSYSVRHALTNVTYGNFKPDAAQ